MSLTTMPGKDPKYKHGPGGRPDKLTPDLQQKILAAVASHQPIDIALALAGCSKAVFYGALQAGTKAAEKVADGAKLSSLSPYERKCLEFSKEYVRAEAQSDARATRVIIDAGRNVQVTEKTATKMVGKDDEGRPIMVTETTVTKAPGDWRAVAWYQEHKPYSKWRSNQRIELTGADGGPIAIEFAARLEGIAGKIKGQDPIPADSQEVDPT